MSNHFYFLLQNDFHFPVCNQTFRRDDAIHRPDHYACSGSFPQCSAERRIHGIVGAQFPDLLHLDHKKHVCAEPLFRQRGQFPQMLCAPFGGGIGKACNAVRFQRDSFDFQKTCLVPFADHKIEPGFSAGNFPPDLSSGREQPASRQPLRRHIVGNLGVHVDEQTVLVDSDQIVLCLPCRIIRNSQINGRTRNQQFPAPPGVLEQMD